MLFLKPSPKASLWAHFIFSFKTSVATEMETSNFIETCGEGKGAQMEMASSGAAFNWNVLFSDQRVSGRVYSKASTIQTENSLRTGEDKTPQMSHSALHGAPPPPLKYV